MTHQPERRSFLRGQFRHKTVMRPPGAVPADAFPEACSACGDCLAACPESILLKDEDGFPKVDLSLGACTFCGDCASACETGALLPTTVWDWRAKPTAECLSLQGVTCRTCEDHCDAQSIRFRLATGGRSEPRMDPDTCTGCGACLTACPTNAITFFQHQPSEETPC
ncbi:ferredoxin-type protein NapF [Shimia abyssi]|uniref:Ferredoxin-type protein NapF n=1 Tax=Shimia abyssi TaxID=1662395 RepID=A0A2P8F981_9RHOB|nr:ferredoxin-type protein NapF [Shimia abyssi]PSL18274.1 ferredoxin-type protein NapF [Shimia abyssi]